MQNILAVSTNTYHGFSLDEALDGIAKAGFKFVELTGVAGWTEHVNWKMDEQQIREVLRKIDSRGLKAIALSGHSNIMDEKGRELFMNNVDLAARLGVSYIITSTGEAHGDKDVIEDENELIHVLKKIVAHCEKKGITLVLETHGNNYATGQSLERIVSKLDTTYIGINYDTANVIFYGRIRPEPDIERSITSVKYVHLKDKSGKDDEWNFPAIGQGNIDFKRIFSTMKAKGYRGPISVEIEFTPSGPGSLERVNEAVAYSFNTIQTLFR